MEQETLLQERKQLLKKHEERIEYFENLKTENTRMKEESLKIEMEKGALKTENARMKEENEKIKKEKGDLEAKSESAKAEIRSLKNRGLIQRIFNRESIN